VAVAAHVEQHGGLQFVRLFFAAHHQLTAPCGRAPVHPTQIVTMAVLTGGHVVVTGGGSRAQHGLAAAPGAGRRQRGERDDRRGDGEGVGGAERPGHLTDPERVGEHQPDRADLPTSAQVTAHPVSDGDLIARGETINHEVWTWTERRRQ
jgi:hypothetical protein